MPVPRPIRSLPPLLCAALVIGCGARSDPKDAGSGDDAAAAANLDGGSVDAATRTAADAGSPDGATTGEDAGDVRADAASADAAAAADGARILDPDASVGGDGSVGTIAIYVAGDLSPVVFGDGLAGQTPYDYEIALSRYDVLRSETDPSPVLCFDLGSTPVVVDVATDNLVGTCRTADVPSGSYTYGRTRVDWARYTVDGVYHYLGQGLPGKFVYFRAYSDTDYAGKHYVAGTGTVTFIGTTTAETPVVYGTPPSVGGVSFTVVGGECFMTFPYTVPLPIDQQDTGAHWARFHWKVWESFRWTDVALAGYQTGVWDVDAVGTEAVGMYGVSSYYVTSSVD
ncbi:MAG: hypothetical protein QM765_28980 [Myxococcales bacterium]